MFTIIDAVIIILTLILIMLGVKRGFVGSVVRLLGGVVRLFLSVVLARPLVHLLSLTKLNKHMFNKFKLSASGISDKFNVNLVGMSEDELNTFIGDALSDAKIPKMFRGLFTNVFSINPETIATKESVTLADFMGVTITNIILLIGSFIFIFVMLWLISFFIKRLSRKSADSTSLFARTNKWLGALFGLVQVAAILFVFFFVISIFENMSIFKGLTDYINNSFITGYIYRFTRNIINGSFDLKNILNGWLNK